MYGPGNPGVGTRCGAGLAACEAWLDYVQASVYQFQEDYSQAIEKYQMSIQLARKAENPVAEMMSTVGLAGMVLEHGQLHLAFGVASKAVKRIERSGVLPPISAVVYASLGDAHYQWYQIEEARRYFQRALAPEHPGWLEYGYDFLPGAALTPIPDRRRPGNRRSRNPRCGRPGPGGSA